jgi:SDR family mycofactocin-dependent oxidoreductase
MPEYNFENKVAFVTGAAHGQGRSHAKHYAKHGADVVITDVNNDLEAVPYAMGSSEELEETANIVEEQGQEVLAMEVDVRNETEVEEAVETAVDEFGHIDILANNAGVVTVGDSVEIDEQAWDTVLDTNLKGSWLCAKHVGQHFVERGGGGKIVSTASTAGDVGMLNVGPYSASKHGVVGLTKSLALELAEYDVNVNAVLPAVVHSQMSEGMVESYGEESMAQIAEAAGPFNLFDYEDPPVDPVDVSEAYMWLSSDAARYVTGISLPVDAGFLAK